MWRSAALTECTRSRRESISVPSRSKITSLMDRGSKGRRVRIIDLRIKRFKNKAFSTQPLAFSPDSLCLWFRRAGELMGFPLSRLHLQCNRVRRARAAIRALYRNRRLVLGIYIFVYRNADGDDKN